MDSYPHDYDYSHSNLEADIHREPYYDAQKPIHGNPAMYSDYIPKDNTTADIHRDPYYAMHSDKVNIPASVNYRGEFVRGRSIEYDDFEERRDSGYPRDYEYFYDDDKGYESPQTVYSEHSRHSHSSSSIASSRHRSSRTADKYSSNSRSSRQNIPEEPERRDSIKMYPEKYQNLRRGASIEDQQQYSPGQEYPPSSNVNNYGDSQLNISRESSYHKIAPDSGKVGSGSGYDSGNSRLAVDSSAVVEERRGSIRLGSNSEFLDRRDPYRSQTQHYQDDEEYVNDTYIDNRDQEVPRSPPDSRYEEDEYHSHHQQYSANDQYDDELQDENMKRSSSFRDYNNVDNEQKKFSSYGDHDIDDEQHSLYDEELEKAYNRKYDTDLGNGLDEQNTHPELGYQDSMDLLEIQRDMGVSPVSETQPSVTESILTKPSVPTPPASANTTVTNTSPVISTPVLQTDKSSSVTASPATPVIPTSQHGQQSSLTSSTQQQPFPRPGYKLMGYPPVEVAINEESAPASQVGGASQTSSTTHIEPEYPPTLPIEVSLPKYGDGVISEMDAYHQQSSFDQSEFGYQESFDSPAQSLHYQDSMDYANERDMHTGTPQRTSERDIG